MKNRSYLLLITVLLGLVIVGCNGGSQPVTPDSNPALTLNSIQSSGPDLWGFWQCSIDPATGQATVVELRTAQFTANVNNLLESKPGNLIIDDIVLDDFFAEGRIDCTVTLQHPFPGVDMYHGFDVWGVFMHNANGSLIYDGLEYGASADEGVNVAVLLNPDGYTRWFNYEEFDGGMLPLFEYSPGKLSSLMNPSATLNAYRVFADGLDTFDDYSQWISDPSNAADRSMFTAGAANSRHYELDFPFAGSMPVLEFQYAVIATWEEGDPTLTGEPTYYEPGDFPSSANCEEAYLVTASTVGSDIYFTSIDDFGGNFTADVEVFDWQGGAVGGNGVPNEVHSIILEADFLPGGTYTFTQSELTSLAIPSTENSSVFQVEITNCTPQASGETEFWMIVESAGLNGESFDQGFPTEFPSGSRRASYLNSTVNVLTESPVPPYEVYDFMISTNRSGTGLVEGIKLEWNQPPDGYPGMNIYKKSAYEDGSNWQLMAGCPVSGAEYVDTDFLGYEGYMYYLAIWNGSDEGTPSQTGFILLENAEETIDTHSVWEDDWRTMGSYYIRWGPLGSGPHSPPPANGTYSWDEAARENFSTYPGDFWTGFWMLLCSPQLPVESDTSVAYVEYMTRVQTYDWSPPADSGYPGGKVGVSTTVDNENFYPSDDHRDGFEYPVDDVPGLYLWGAFVHCSQPEAGMAGSYSYWQFSSYNLPDIFTLSNPRASFAFGSVNNAGGYGWNVDDIAVIIY